MRVLTQCSSISSNTFIQTLALSLGPLPTRTTFHFHVMWLKVKNLLVVCDIHRGCECIMYIHWLLFGFIKHFTRVVVTVCIFVFIFCCKHYFIVAKVFIMALMCTLRQWFIKYINEVLRKISCTDIVTLFENVLGTLSLYMSKK